MKKLITLLLVLILAFGLFGCREQEIPTAPNLTAPPTSNSGPTLPTLPTGSTTGTEPTKEQTSPTDPIDPTEDPTEPTEPVEPTHPTEPTEPQPPDVTITWAGLYEDGALDLLTAEGPDAIEGMLIMSWDELLEAGILYIESEELFSGYLGDYNLSSPDLDGELILPNVGVNAIGEDGLRECENLSAVYIPNTITQIKQNAFRDSEVECVYFEENSNLNKIGYYAFAGCRKLHTFDVPEKVTTIIEGAFHMSGLRGIVLPESVTTLGNNIFFGCDKLENATLPSSITCVPEGMFQECDALKNIIIPDCVTIIKSNAFRECETLTSVILPTSLQKIEKYAFAYCWELGTIQYKGTKADWKNVSTGSNCFSSIPASEIRCFDGSVSLWA